MTPNIEQAVSTARWRLEDARKRGVSMDFYGHELLIDAMGAKIEELEQQSRLALPHAF